MSKGIFLRLREEVYEQLEREAKNKAVSVPGLIKSILSGYAYGKLRLLSSEEETLLRTRVELIPVRDKVEELERYINEHLKPRVDKMDVTVEKILNDYLSYKQIVDHVMVLEQKVNSLEVRVKNIEKSKRWSP